MIPPMVIPFLVLLPLLVITWPLLRYDAYARRKGWRVPTPQELYDLNKNRYRE